MGNPVKWTFYNSFLLEKNDGTQNLDSDTFKVALFLSTSNCADVTKSTYASLDNQHAQEYGYTTGGETVVQTLTGESQNVNFTTADAVWTANGGSIIARWAVKYNSAGGLVAYSLMDDAPADKEATNTNTFTVSDHADGMFDEAPAA